MEQAFEKLTRPQQLLAAMMLALANFIVVLDMTIANVSVPHIAGGLAVSPSQGTYVITSYAVAEAIIVPLTGWLAGRFGSVKVFVVSMLMFGICSALCGAATSIEALVFFRILQGLSGGPLMPISQALLIRIFPREKIGGAMALWSMTTLLAPVLGPTLGGYISDNIGWEFIFFINVPIAILCSLLVWRTLAPVETETEKNRIDTVGLTLLIVWVAALQFMLDKGKELDWFASPLIVSLAITSAIGFAAFMIWELTADKPIVDLRIFRHRGFAMGTVTISLAFGSFFALNVLTPLWLQSYMGYTATDAGMVMGMNGMIAIFVAPFVARMLGKVDGRMLVFFGVMWLAGVTFWRSFYTTDVTFWQLAGPILVQGIGMPFFFIPLTNIALSSVQPKETASAAGLFNFVRTLSGAFATSLVTTAWENDANANHAQMVGDLDKYGDVQTTLVASGMTSDQAMVQLDHLLQGQAVMLANNHIFQVLVLCLIAAACSIWFAPKPTRVAKDMGGH
ncbi:MAG: MFS transporter [Pseudomonas fluorescens]|nr:MAG: MFS transporter [Pseudomonas fluorescens]